MTQKISRPVANFATGFFMRNDNVDGGENILRLIKSRRSVRFYKKQDIPPETLTELTDMLAYPPTGGNRDNLHFSIVGTAAKMHEIVKLTYETIEATDKPSPMMVFCLEQY